MCPQIFLTLRLLLSEVQYSTCYYRVRVFANPREFASTCTNTLRRGGGFKTRFFKIIFVFTYLFSFLLDVISVMKVVMKLVKFMFQ